MCASDRQDSNVFCSHLFATYVEHESGLVYLPMIPREKGSKQGLRISDTIMGKL